MKEIFYELIQDAKEDKLEIDGYPLHIAFNTIIEDNKRFIGNEKYPTLIINNEDPFFKLLNQYLELEHNIKRSNNINDKILIAYIFANATTEDFLNPETLLRRNISFLKDSTFKYLNTPEIININNLIPNSKLIIKNSKNSIYNETPYQITAEITDGESSYPLANISYGIQEENGKKTCYIYSIMRRNNIEHNPYQKKIERFLYKINANIYENESNEYKDYKEGKSTYYPENISDVTPSFVLSLNIFMSLLQKEHIEEIKAVPYLPIRYLSRSIAANIQNSEELEARNNRIQYSITNKFIRLFTRLSYHMEELNITSLPYELDEFLTLNLKTKKIKNNNSILEEISSKISNISNNEKVKEAVLYALSSNSLEGLELEDNDIARIIRSINSGKKDKSFLYELVKEMEKKDDNYGKKK